MTPLQKAFSILGLEPGSSKQSIQTRYRRLIIVWHPDRFVSVEDKKSAEDELKKINNAKDLLWKHFESGTHKASGCECQQTAAPPPDPGPKPGPGPGRSRTHTDDEEQAKRRDEERKRKAAAEEAARQQQQDQQRRAQQQTFAEAEKQEVALKENKLRWTVATAEGALLVALCLFGWIGTGINAACHDFAWRWEQDHKPKTDNTNTGEHEKPWDPTYRGMR